MEKIMDKCFWCEKPFTFGDIIANFIGTDEQGHFIGYSHQSCQSFVYKCQEKGENIKTSTDFMEMKKKYEEET